MNRICRFADKAPMIDHPKEIAMNRELKILLLNAALVGGVGGYAVTRWGTAGALGSVALALLIGIIQRHYRK